MYFISQIINYYYVKSFYLKFKILTSLNKEMKYQVFDWIFPIIRACNDVVPLSMTDNKDHDGIEVAKFLLFQAFAELFEPGQCQIVHNRFDKNTLDLFFKQVSKVFDVILGRILTFEIKGIK
jgi:hypothetical protein